VWVFEEPDAPFAPDRPLAGAEIAFDPPGGGARVLATVAPDGHATFTGDFTQGGGAVTVFDPDHVLVSAIEVSPNAARAHPNTRGLPAADLVVLAPSLDQVLLAQTVALKGTLRGKRDAATSIDLSASGVARLDSVVSTDGAYTLRAPKGRPFFLLGYETTTQTSDTGALDNELVRSFRVEVPALGGDTTLDLDVLSAPQLPTRDVHLRAVLPTSAGTPFRAGTESSAIVVSADSRLLLAPIRSVHPEADGRGFQLAMAVAETSLAPERPLTRVALVAADGSRSVRVEPGVVPEGTVFDDFLPPPQIKAGTAPTGLNEPIELVDFPADASMEIEVFAGPQLAWVITAPARDAARAQEPIRLPVPLEIRLPALVSATFSARVDAAALPPRGEVYRRVSTSHDVLFRR
jgi:hypothetical protein